MSQPSLLQNNTQTVQVNEFIDNISRNTTYHGSHSFSFEYSIDTTGEDDKPLLLDDINDKATENILIPNWYSLVLSSIYDALNPSSKIDQKMQQLWKNKAVDVQGKHIQVKVIANRLLKALAQK
jgi:hypothetical protein